MNIKKLATIAGVRQRTLKNGMRVLYTLKKKSFVEMDRKEHPDSTNKQLCHRYDLYRRQTLCELGALIAHSLVHEGDFVPTGVIADRNGEILSIRFSPAARKDAAEILKEACELFQCTPDELLEKVKESGKAQIVD